ncbi:HAD family hydrolase [Streptomyces sp. NPDC051913]|uniref:HAD family hydrolase n=1 Tax=Streptomyces sp. NPDC051913 TaxID=3365676 RepID=UPI0037D26D0D
MNDALRAVVFDFSGTLFGRLSGHDWLFDTQDRPAEEERARAVHALRHPAEFVDRMTPAQLRDWADRDLSPEANHRAYGTLFRLAGLGEADFARIYGRLSTPSNWHPYEDTLPALERLARAGARVAVLSNISWDIREAFIRHGSDRYVAQYVLSYEEGRAKPDLELFRVAARRLGVAPEECLMVGDDPVCDGAAPRVGMAFAKVATGPVGTRGPVLLGALARYGW